MYFPSFQIDVNIKTSCRSKSATVQLTSVMGHFFMFCDWKGKVQSCNTCIAAVKESIRNECGKIKTLLMF